MNKISIITLTLLVGVAGCCKKKQNVEPRPDKEIAQIDQINIPVADNEVNSLFDEDVSSFELIEDQNTQTIAKAVDAATDDFAWVDETKDASFDVVYFDFDKFEVRQDQLAVLGKNVSNAKKAYDAAVAEGKQLTVVIDGHADHAAGSRAYNLALSEKRAKVLADAIVAAGIPAEHVKVVARGSEFPAIVDGKPVEGGRQEQWANRRDEVRILFS